MKRALAVLLIVALSVIAAVAPVIGQQQVDATAEKKVYGFRLESDMLFYVQVGLIHQNDDLIAGIGWNNNIWFGAHKYFHSNEEFAAFSGIEMHIVYPVGETIEAHPALPLGFAMATNTTTIVVEAIVFPALAGEPINVKFAVSLLFEI